MITQLIKLGKIAPILLLLSIWKPAIAQEDILSQYIDSAVQNNLVLKSKNVSIEKAQLSLTIAKSYYLPSSAVQIGYQTADGGRIIPLPLGDMLNGVYSTLNSLTNSSSFPQLNNQNIQFLPKNFYDAKLHTTMPIYDADINYGKKIADQQIKLSQLDLDVYKRNLVKDVKEAYFQYLMGLQAILIYQQSLTLAQEGQRVNQKLLDNGKGLPAYVLRSQSEVENVKAQITSAQQQAKNAGLYFNFLLNRNLDDSINIDYSAQQNILHASTLVHTDYNTDSRTEIKSLLQQQYINETLLAKNKAAYYPKLNTFLDLGSQAQDWHFNSESRYYMFGIQLSMPLYSGNRIKNQMKQSLMDGKMIGLGLAQARQQYNLITKSAINKLQASIQNYTAKQKQFEAAAAYQRLIERGYKAGSNTYIETVDARNQFTQAQIDENIQAFQVLIDMAEVERNINN